MTAKKITYSINQENQLVVILPDTKKGIPVDGDFYIDHKNNLLYILDNPQHWRNIYNIPGKVYFKGKWDLDENHNIVLRLRDNKDLRLSGRIVNVKGDELSFQIRSRKTTSVETISFLRFTGKWKTDKFNRIIFEIRKSATTDTLVFKNAWHIRENHQIVYEYHILKTKQKNILLFQGYWEIIDKNRIRYILEGEKDNKLDVKVYLETPNVYPAKGKIKYRFGVGLKTKRKERFLVLTGIWKFSRKFGLSFEVDYGKGKIQRFRFNATLDIGQKDRLVFEVYSRQNRPLGIRVTFFKHHHQIPKKDFEFLIRLTKQGKSPYIEVGGKINF